MSLIKSLKKAGSRDSVDSTSTKSSVSGTMSDRGSTNFNQNVADIHIRDHDGVSECSSRESIMSSSTLSGSECKAERPSRLLAFEQFQGGRLSVMVEELKKDKIECADEADDTAYCDNDNDSSISDGEDLASCHSDNDSTISQRGTDRSTTTSAQEQERQQDQDNDNLDESESESNHGERSSQPKSRYSIHQPKSEVCYEFCSRAAVVSIVFVAFATILCLLMAGLCSCGCIKSGSGQASTSTAAQAEVGESLTADGGVEEVLPGAAQSLDLGSQDQDENDNTKTEQNQKQGKANGKSSSNTTTATSANSNGNGKVKDKNAEAVSVDHANFTKRKNTKSSPKQSTKKKTEKSKKGKKRNSNTGLKTAQNQKKSSKSNSSKKSKIKQQNKNASLNKDGSSVQKQKNLVNLQKASLNTALKKAQNKDKKSKESKTKVEKQKSSKQKTQTKNNNISIDGKDDVTLIQNNQPQPEHVKNENQQIREASKVDGNQSETTATVAKAQAEVQLNEEHLAVINSQLLPDGFKDIKISTITTDEIKWIGEQIDTIDNYKKQTDKLISDLKTNINDHETYEYFLHDYEEQVYAVLHETQLDRKDERYSEKQQKQQSYYGFVVDDRYFSFVDHFLQGKEVFEFKKWNCPISKAILNIFVENFEKETYKVLIEKQEKEGGNKSRWYKHQLAHIISVVESMQGNTEIKKVTFTDPKSKIKKEVTIQAQLGYCNQIQDRFENPESYQEKLKKSWERRSETQDQQKRIVEKYEDFKKVWAKFVTARIEIN